MIKFTKSSHGFGLIGILIVIAVIALAGGGGLYWNEAKKQQTFLETGAGAIKRAEELKKQIESRQEQLYGSRTAIQNYTAYNNERSFGGYNMGDSVILYWYTVPDGASKISLYRSSSAEGPWVQIRDYPVDGLKYGPVDGVDGTKADIYYKAEAISASGAVLKEYGVLRIPKYINEYDDLESSKIDTSTWKTYRNEKYGFEFMHPENARVVDDRPDYIRIQNYGFAGEIEDNNSLATGEFYVEIYISNTGGLTTKQHCVSEDSTQVVNVSLGEWKGYRLFVFYPAEAGGDVYSLCVNKGDIIIDMNVTENNGTVSSSILDSVRFFK